MLQPVQRGVASKFENAMSKRSKRARSDSSNANADHTYTPKQIANFYLEAVDGTDPSGFWQCKCKEKVKRSSSGWGNLHLHVTRRHPDHLAEMRQAHLQREWLPDSGFQVDRSQVRITSFVPRGADKIYGWLDWVISNLFPFSFVENAKNREYSHLDKTDHKTLMKYMFLLVKRVERKIANEMPKKIGLMFDGWSENRYHFVGIFALGMQSQGTKFKRLVSFSVMTLDHVEAEAMDDFSVLLEESDDTSGMKFDARAYCKLFEETLNFYDKTLADVCVLIGDNCSTNKALASLLGVHFMGCYSHRFNLAVKKYLIQYGTVLTRLETLCKRLRTLKHSAELREVTPCVPQISCVTRWSGVYSMVKNFTKLKDSISFTREMADVILSDEEEAKIVSLLPVLHNLNEVTLCLQKDGLEFCTARQLMDGVIAELDPDGEHELSSKIGRNSSIIHNIDFENALFKILKKREATLSPIEEECMRCFLIEPDIVPGGQDEAAIANQSFVDSLFGKYVDAADRENAVSVGASKYEDLSWIPPTSNDCERFFSAAGRAYGANRRSMDVVSFEAQMFLHVNRDLWNLQDIIDIMRQDTANE